MCIFLLSILTGLTDFKNRDCDLKTYLVVDCGKSQFISQLSRDHPPPQNKIAATIHLLSLLLLHPACLQVNMLVSAVKLPRDNEAEPIKKFSFLHSCAPGQTTVICEENQTQRLAITIQKLSFALEKGFLL